MNVAEELTELWSHWRLYPEHRRCHDRPVSPLGIAVAEVLAATWGGLHNVVHADKVDWSDPRCIVAYHDANLATHDFRHLADLVILCHDAALRLDLSIGGFAETYEDLGWRYRCLELTFHPRLRHESARGSTHPTIEESIVLAREKRSRFVHGT